MKNFYEIEQLSAYLDGQLSTSDAARLEARLKSDPELASVMRDLRAARGILRQLPARRAPRNFTLTRKMVGLKPPLPRSYPIFRLATVFAAVLFVFSFTANTLAPMISFGGAAAPAPAFGMGGGGSGGGCEEPCGGGAAESSVQPEELAQEAAPAATEAPPASQDTAPATTQTARIIEPTSTPTLKEGQSPAPIPTAAANLVEVTEEPPVALYWPVIFLALSIVGGAAMWVMRLTARSKWR